MPMARRLAGWMAGAIGHRGAMFFSRSSRPRPFATRRTNERRPGLNKNPA
jgi:hypothetical protein